MGTANRLVLGLVLTVCFLAPGAVGEEDEQPQPVPPAPAPQPEAPPAADPTRPPRRMPGQPLPRGLRQGWREAMWPAATAEEWKKPCLITWQRTWDDAVAVAREEGKPILVCINMDGEIASEHYAGVRYRQPEITKLYEPYVTVIASVYRHNPRDHDDEGNRILCPRFGCVTCGEHIAIEPIIFEKFCDGKRIAPRHIAVDLDDNEAYDVYYTDDTQSVFDAIREGRAKFPEAKPPIVRGDRPILERVASRHVDDRVAVESAYLKGDSQTRGKLLDAASRHRDAAQLDLLRLAVFGLDVDLGRKARQALAQAETPDATTLISEALRVPMDTKERDALIGALKRLGESSTLAQWLAGVHQGLAGHSSAVDVKGWSETRAGATYPAIVVSGEGSALAWKVEDQARAAAERPDDPAPRLELAEASLALARKVPEIYVTNQRLLRMVSRQLYQDAERAAREAEELGASDWRVNAVLALAAYYTDDLDTAYDRAAAALASLPPGEPSWNAMAVVTVFAEGRWKAIKKAVREKADWPPEWLSDLHAAYAILQRHPLGTDGQVVWHYEFLVWLGAEHRAARVLRKGLERFEHSPLLHQRFRERLLRRRGTKALEAAYERMLKEQEESAMLLSYAGVASITAAEHYRRTKRFEYAVAAYDRAIDHYERATRADERVRPAADHVVAHASAGKARVAYELGDDETATTEMLASFARSPASAGSRDGMGITPGETAQMLLARLREAERVELATTLEAAMSTLDQELLRPDRGLLPDR